MSRRAAAFRALFAGAALLSGAAAPAAAGDCFSIGPAAEFCAGDEWVFMRYVEDGVMHLAADEKFYHLHKLREVALDAGPEVAFEEHAASFAIQYGGEAYEDVVSSQGERWGRRTLEYEFTVKDWDEGNRTRLTFLIAGGMGYSFVTSGRPPVDRAELNARHEAALAAFRLNGTDQ